MCVSEAVRLRAAAKSGMITWCRAGVGKVWLAGQIRPASSVDPARGGPSVVTLWPARIVTCGVDHGLAFHTHVNVARSTVNAVLSILSGERIASSLSVRGSLSVEVGYLNKTIGDLRLYWVCWLVAFIPVRPVASSLEAHPALYHKKFADPWCRGRGLKGFVPCKKSPMQAPGAVEYAWPDRIKGPWNRHLFCFL